MSKAIKRVFARLNIEKGFIYRINFNFGREVLKREFADSEETFNGKSDRSEIRWNIPLDYSSWSIEEKQKLVEECLGENCS